MKCNEVNKKILFFAEGDLLPEEQTEIRKHLDGCTGCMELFVSVEETVNVIDKERNMEINPFFSARVMHYIKEKKGDEKAIPFFIGRPRFVSFAATIIAGIVIGILVGNSLWLNSSSQTLPSGRSETLIVSANEYYLNDDFTESWNSYFFNQQK